VVTALMISMIEDWVSKKILLFHAIAEMHVHNGDGKECDRDSNPKNILHG
jgi:hypothetical protein